MPKNNLTASQIDFVLADIANIAKQIDRLNSLLLSEGANLFDGEAVHVAIECMAQRIGWAADMAMSRSERSIGPCYGDAADWMMPPLFHNEAEQLAQTNGMGNTANPLGRV